MIDDHADVRPELLKTAIHESGHAVFIVRVGVGLRQIRLTWNEEDRRWEGQAKREDSNVALDLIARIALAGPLTECKYLAALNLRKKIGGPLREAVHRVEPSPNAILEQLVPAVVELLEEKPFPKGAVELCFRDTESHHHFPVWVGVCGFEQDFRIARCLCNVDDDTLTRALLATWGLLDKSQNWHAILTLADKLVGLATTDDAATEMSGEAATKMIQDCFVATRDIGL